MPDWGKLEREKLGEADGLALFVRPMTGLDLPAVISIEARVHEFPWRPMHFANCLEEGNPAFVVEEALGENFKIVAYALVSVGGREADLLNVAVAPERRRRGIARLLLKHVIARIAPRADTLFLEVRASNQAAIGLYEQLGFNQVGERPNYYPARQGREDALILALGID